MKNQFFDRAISQSEWKDIRFEVRRHSLMNSKEALGKRMLLSRLDQKVLMGGIVVKKQDMVVILSDENNDRYQARCAVPLERAAEKMERAIADGFSPVMEGSGFNFLIYDFSGFFEVNGSLADFDRDLRRKMYQIKEGDVVFVAGDFVSLNSPSGYFIRPSSFYSEEEIAFYRQVYSKRYDAIRQKMNKIKLKRFSEPDEYALGWARCEWDIVKLFLRKNRRLKSNDYYWLESAARHYFDKTEDVRAARLVLKYYLSYMKEEKKRYVAQENRSYPVDLKQDFFETHSDLQGVVEWPNES